MAEFYDLANYTSAKAVATDVGVTLVTYESGTSVRCKAKMSQVAEHLKQRGKPVGVILVAAIRKLLHLAFGVVKNKTPFNPDFEASRPSLST